MWEELHRFSPLEGLLIANVIAMTLTLTIAHLKKRHGKDHKFLRMQSIINEELPKEAEHLHNNGLNFNDACCLSRIKVINSVWAAYCDSYTCTEYLLEDLAKEAYDLRRLYDNARKAGNQDFYCKAVIEAVDFSRAACYYAEEIHGIHKESLGWL
ncbi:hypothetical protein [Vibrio phage BONAISHI]|nr:hypothetical protein [Vibrio phage BONAISHI]